MNREGAETCLRRLAEAAMRRGQAAGQDPAAWPGDSDSHRTRLKTVGQALVTVGALDAGTLEEFLADFNLAMAVRLIGDPQVSFGPGGRAAVLALPGPSVHQLPMAWAVRLGIGRSPGGAGPASPGPAGTGLTGTGAAGTGAASTGLTGTGAADPRPEPARPQAGTGLAGAPPDDGEADRFVPVGLTVPFRDEAVSGELYLMSFARTQTGARFFAVWGIRAPALRDISLIPFGQFTVADDRGGQYRLDGMPSGDSGWTSEIGLCPAPPPGIRWLDVTAPGHAAVRVSLDPAAHAGARADVSAGATQASRTEPSQTEPSQTEPSQTGLNRTELNRTELRQAQVSQAELSPGELLLVMIAERLLTAVPEHPRNPWRRPVGGTVPPALRATAAGLGDIVAALEAADVLSPGSPVPGRLATLCASLDIAGHGITAPPAPRLPENWLSVLAHYQRRKPEPIPLLEGYAAMTAALPEVSGIRLVLLGLHHTEGGSSLYMLARGELPEAFLAPFGIDPTFPLSIWLRDSGGRWHAARPAERHPGRPRGRRDGEWTVRLQLVPPLTRATPWAEVLAGGQTAEVRARLPLRWGYPS